MNRIYSFLISFLLIITAVICLFHSNCYIYAINNDNDYSNPSSINSVEISTLDFFSTILNEKLTDCEKETLSNKGVFLKYENKIPTNYVETSINDNVLHVTAYEYSYNDVNNRQIIWYPKEVILNDKVKQFTKNEDYYSCTFDDLLASNDSIKVYYSLKLLFDKDEINKTLNETYDLAVEKNANYEEQLQKYNNDLKLYNQYLNDLSHYQSEMDKYNQYLKAKADWDTQNTLYLQYLSDYEAYLKYEEYKKEWQQYLVDMEKYNTYTQELKAYEDTLEEKTLEYQKYVEEMKKVNYRISILSLITKEMTSLNRSIYSAVIGSTVDKVLENEASLIEYGVDAKVVETARNATNKLRELFAVYVSLDNDKDIYSFYVTNYSSIKENSEKLLASLEYLYRKGPVEKFLGIVQSIDNNYKEKYIILIAQLGLFCNALDDYDVKNYEKQTIINLTSWKIDNRTIKDVLGDEINIVDDSIKGYAPKKSQYPVQVDKPTPPTVVNQPVAPTPVVPAEEPKKVDDPGNEPAKVSEPVKPQVVKQPTEIEKLEGFDANLVSEYKNGQLKKHELLNENYEYLIDTFLNKKIRNEGKVTITFYDEERLNILATEETDIGEHIVYSGIIPTKTPDNVIYQSYEFNGWVDDDGNVVDLNNVTKDLFVFPIFKGVYKKYQITWKLPNNEIVEEYDYGRLPQAPTNITKEDDENYYYSFKGWNTEIETVKENKEYIAIFNAFPYYTITWNVGAQQYKHKYKEGDIPSINEELLVKANTSTQYFCFSTWDKNIEPVKENKEYIAIFDSYSFAKSDDKELAVIFYENNVVINTNVKNIDISGLLNYDSIKEYNLLLNINSISILVDAQEIEDFKNNNITNIELLEDIESNKNKYKLRFMHQNNVVNLECDVHVSFNGEYDKIHTRVYEDGNVIKSIIDDKNISFLMRDNHEYRISSVYFINILPSNIEINTKVEEAEVGQTVSINLGSLPMGMKLDKLYVQDTNYNDISIIDNSFIMPASDVFVGANITRIEYTVSFVIDGEIISSNKYFYGDEVDVPKNTFKISDDQYSYEFIGWDKEITLVYEDAIYVANYETKPIVDDAYRGINILRIAKIVIISILSTILILIGLFIYLKKRSKRKF